MSPALAFTEQDLLLFRDASGDRNPLHLSPEYARSTAYGQPVVFGCLAAVACLGYLRLPPGWEAASLEANFPRPMFPGVSYRVEAVEKNGQWMVHLFDGSIPMTSVTVTGRPGREQTPRKVMATEGIFGGASPAVWRAEEIVPGLRVTGEYACNAAALNALMARWGAADRRLATALAWSSYLVGMELPGESALFEKLALRFEETAEPFDHIRYGASVASVDARLGQIGLSVSVSAGGVPLASGRYRSFLRPLAPPVEETDFPGVNAQSLPGRVAILLGSSRGLGAALRRSLELRGAIVYGMARSPSAGGPPRTEVGDAADPEALRRLRERVMGEHDRLDILICNAFPPILPLRLEPNAAGRITAYINQAVSLTLTPLTEFLEPLNRCGGCAVIVSSAAVENPVREWPHYIAAKQAAEALGRVAAMQYPRVHTLIVRPPKLLTAMTNTPMGRVGAASPAALANRIATRLEGALAPGATEILD